MRWWIFLSLVILACVALASAKGSKSTKSASSSTSSSSEELTDKRRKFNGAGLCRGRKGSRKYKKNEGFFKDNNCGNPVICTSENKSRPSGIEGGCPKKYGLQCNKNTNLCECRIGYTEQRWHGCGILKKCSRKGSTKSAKSSKGSKSTKSASSSKGSKSTKSASSSKGSKSTKSASSSSEELTDKRRKFNGAGLCRGRKGSRKYKKNEGFFKDNNCGNPVICTSENKSRPSGIEGGCPKKYGLQCNKNTNLCECRIGYTEQRWHGCGILKKCSRKGSTKSAKSSKGSKSTKSASSSKGSKSTKSASSSSEERKGPRRPAPFACRAIGGRYRKGQYFFKDKNCNTAHICTGYGQSKRLTKIRNGCNYGNMVCSPDINECVCKKNYMVDPEGNSNNFARLCKPRPDDTAGCCENPFVRLNGDCLYVSTDKLNRRNAERVCKYMDAQLVVFSNIGAGCKRLKSLRDKEGGQLIAREILHIGGIEMVGPADSKRFDGKEKARRRKFAQKCGNKDGTIPKRASGYQKVRERDDENKDKRRCGVNYEKDQAGQLDWIDQDRKLRYVCQKTVSSLDTSKYQYTPYISSYGRGGSQTFSVGGIFRRKEQKKYHRCCPVDIQCRFKKDTVSIPIGKGTVQTTRFMKPLKLDGVNTILKCTKRQNKKDCPPFQCRMLCPPGTEECGNNGDCKKGEICKRTTKGRECRPKRRPRKGCAQSFYFIHNSIKTSFYGGKCSSRGDPHIDRFDKCVAKTGRSLNYMSVCKGKLVCYDGGPLCAPWCIIADFFKRPGREDSHASWTKSIRFTGCDNKVFKIGQSKDGSSFPSFTVDGVDMSPNYKSDCIICECGGGRISCTTKCGVKFSFDTRTADIFLDEKYKGNVDGLCGNYNDDPDDDLRMEDGSPPEGNNQRQKDWHIGNQYRVEEHDDEDETCDDENPKMEVLLPCKDERMTFATTKGACGTITQSSVYPYTTEAESTNAYTSCYEDYCETGDVKDICTSLETAAKELEDDNPDVKVSWRNATSINCPIPKCNENEEYSRYESQEYCFGDTDTTDIGGWGCHCAKDRYFIGGRCVPAEECGCRTEDGIEIKIGKSIRVKCNTVIECLAPTEEDGLPTINTRRDYRCSASECRRNRCRCGKGRKHQNRGCVDKEEKDFTCEKGWMKVGKKCMAFVSKKYWWLTAQRLCAASMDTATLFRMDSLADKENLESFLKKKLERYRGRVPSKYRFHFWLAGCVEREEGRTVKVSAKSLSNSVDMPFYAYGLNIDAGCLQVSYSISNQAFKYKGETRRNAVKYGICEHDPYKKIPESCEMFKPNKRRYGASFKLCEIRDRWRFEPERGHHLCRNPTKIECFDENNKPFRNSRTRHCSKEKGFWCKGRKCRKYRVRICCPKRRKCILVPQGRLIFNRFETSTGEQLCSLFPNACERATQRCHPFYYSHACTCKKGYNLTPDGRCIAPVDQCLCGCSGDPHCIGCPGKDSHGFKMDFMGTCNYTAISNKCPWMKRDQIYPSLEVIAEHRPCGRPDKAVSCAKSLHIEVCRSYLHQKTKDCINAYMQTFKNLTCTISYDNDKWMEHQYFVKYDGCKCHFYGPGLKITMQGSTWLAVIDEQHKDNMCGYCGAWSSTHSSIVNKDGIPYDFKTKKIRKKFNGKTKNIDVLTRKDATRMGDSFVVNDNDRPECRRTEVGDDCTDAEKANAAVQCQYFQNVSKLLNDTELFKVYMEQCSEDLCKAGDDFLCSSLETYVDEYLKDQGMDEAPNWKKQMGSPCPYQCNQENNEIPSEKKFKQKFCDGSDVDDIPDCVCASGFMYDEGTSHCVEQSDCSCKTTMTGEMTFIPSNGTAYNPKMCTEKYKCEKGDLLQETSDAADEATCTIDKLTGCREGYKGNGKYCKENVKVCTNGWKPLIVGDEEGCIRIVKDPENFPLAAEKCRMLSGELVKMPALDAPEILKLLQGEPSGTKVFVSGVCGAEYEKFHDGSVKGADSYIPADWIDCNATEDKNKCFTVELTQGNVIKMNPSNCMTPQIFICKKKPNDDYEWTDYCNGNVLKDGSTPDKETKRSMREANCEMCAVPRDIECELIDGGGSNEDDGTCSLNRHYFVGSFCNNNDCKDYQVRLFCPDKFDECSQKADMCTSGEKCRDTELGYRCECDKGYMPVIENRKESCKREVVCQMRRRSSMADLFLKRFDVKNEISFEEECSFILLDNFGCKEDAPTVQTRIVFVNVETTESRHLIISVNGDVVKVFADGTVTLNSVTKQGGISRTNFRLNVASPTKYSFRLKDKSLQCSFKYQGAKKFFQKIQCVADEMFTECGVCRTEPVPLSNSEDHVNDFFEENKAPNTAAKCTGEQSGGSSTGSATFGSLTTVAVTSSTDGGASGDDCALSTIAKCTMIIVSIQPHCPSLAATLSGQCRTAACDNTVGICQFLEDFLIGKNYGSCGVNDVPQIEMELRTAQTENECTTTPMQTQSPTTQPQPETTPMQTQAPTTQPQPETTPMQTQAPTTQPQTETTLMQTQAPTTQPQPETTPMQTQAPSTQPQPEPTPTPTENPCEKCANAITNTFTETCIQDLQVQNLYQDCAKQVCEDKGDLCDAIKDIVESMETDDSIGSGCGTPELQQLVLAMRKNAACAITCRKPNEADEALVPMLNPPEIAKTCKDRNAEAEPSQIRDLDPECVCKEDYVLDEETNPKKCVLMYECGCHYGDDRIKVDDYYHLNDDCSDIKVCRSNGELVSLEHGCATNAHCENKNCECNEGFMGNGYKECRPVIEFNNKICSLVYDDNEETDTMICNCKPGYAASCDRCIAINKCNTREDPCGDGTNCVHPPGSPDPECECKPGYERDKPTTCKDIKECSQVQSPCSKNATCFERKGGYSCKCCEGYTKDSNGVCQPMNPDNIPAKCCVCSLAACYKTPPGEPEAICYTDANGKNTTFETFKLAFISLCMQDKPFNGTDWVYGKCDNPDAIVTTPTSGSTPVEGTESSPPPTGPCSGICDDSETMTISAKGQICEDATQMTYSTFCLLKKSRCQSNSSPPTEADYSLGACVTTTTPPPTTSPDWKYGNWSAWTKCNAKDCADTNGTQFKERTATPVNPDANLPYPVDDCIIIRSCRKEGCDNPDGGDVTDKEPENCDEKCDQSGDALPVCGKVNSGTERTFSSKCILQKAACKAGEGARYSIVKWRACEDDDDETDENRPCRLIPDKTVVFNITHRDENCVFPPVQMNVCMGYCTGSDGNTASTLCCQAASYRKETIDMDTCSNGKGTPLFQTKEPASCECVDKEN